MDHSGSQTGAYSAFIPNLGGAALLAANPIRRRLRDQYIAARFPAFSQSSRDFADSAKVIRYARDLFDGEEPERAIELLRLAIEENPDERAKWLALIELAYSQGNPGEFAELIHAFAVKFPQDRTIDTQRAMAHALAPQDPAFANAPELISPPNWSTDEQRQRNQENRQTFHQMLDHRESR